MVLVVAHRGGLIFGEHNSVSAVKETISRKAADIIEIDVWQTKDGFICSHGGYIGLTGLCGFHAHSSEDIQKHHKVDLFEDIVKVVGKKCRLLIHFKSFQLDVPRFLKAIKSLKSPIFMSNKWNQIEVISRRVETVFFGYPSISSIRKAKALGAKGIEFMSLRIPVRSVEEVKRQGMYFSAAGFHPAFLSQNCSRMNKAIELGAKWVVVDDPIKFKHDCLNGFL